MKHDEGARRKMDQFGASGREDNEQGNLSMEQSMLECLTNVILDLIGNAVTILAQSIAFKLEHPCFQENGNAVQTPCRQKCIKA